MRISDCGSDVCSSDLLMTGPAIADAAAVAVPSVEWGEAVGIAVVTRPGHAAPSEDELKTLIRNRLRSSRCPERVAMLDALPYNDMGMLLRRKVKQTFIALAALRLENCGSAGHRSPVSFPRFGVWPPRLKQHRKTNH